MCLGSVVLGRFSVVGGGSVGCSVIFGGLGVVSRLCCGVILGFLGVVYLGIVRGCVRFGLFCVVLGSLGVVASWSVGCGVVNWSLGVIAWYRVVLWSIIV